VTYGREREQLLAGLSDDEIGQLDDAVGRLLEVLTDAAQTSGVASLVNSSATRRDAPS
jgi:hypothetical protein